jgi:hypothetical protein
MKVVPFDADPHFAVQTLLPWYATNRIDAADAAQVEAHLAGCPACRAELELERRLQAASPLSITPGEVERGWAGMRELIRSGAPRAQPAAAPWLRWVLGAQLAIIAALAVMVALPRAGGDDYRALGAPSAAATANVLVIFKPEATEQAIRSALRISGARIVDGPTPSNAYLLSMRGEDRAGAMARLRAQPAVLLAESLDAKPGS